MHIGRHRKVDTMVIENLEECIHVVEYCLRYRKINNSNLWGPPHALNGCLGHPAFILLMTNIDTLGGLLGGNKEYPLFVRSSGEKEEFRYHSSGSGRFKILNTEYFDFNLPEQVIKDLYQYGRSDMIHNAALGRDIELIPLAGPKAIQVNPIHGKGRIKVYLPTLLKCCKEAVEKFKKNSAAIVAASRYGPNFKSIGSFKKGHQ